MRNKYRQVVEQGRILDTQHHGGPVRRGIVKLFGNGCGAVDVSGLGGER